MAVQKVVTYGHSALRAISKNITDFSNIRSLIDDLFDTMYEFDGIGLAANQIGINKRIFVVDLSHTEECESPLVFINGKIISGEGSCVDSEGCLSLPEIRINVERYDSITYEYLDHNLENCLLYTSDAADERSCVDLGGRRIIKKKWRQFITNKY